jgi:hypothetical protein
MRLVSSCALFERYPPKFEGKGTQFCEVMQNDFPIDVLYTIQNMRGALEKLHRYKSQVAIIKVLPYKLVAASFFFH